VPQWRVDILHEVDIAEDIAIAYGYEKFEPEIPKISTTGEEDPREKIKRKISEIFSGAGMLELSTYHLLTKYDLKKSNKRAAIEVEKSKTDYTMLRPELLTSLLKVMSENIDAEYPQKIFEIGKVFTTNDREETGIKESEHLIVSCCPGNFTEIKQILEYLAKMLDIKLNVEETTKQGFIDGRTAKILFERKEIGTLGEIHPTLLKNWHLKMPLALFEINLENIL
jgi:phenylalanyl-tRNA synthetase beta chain